MGSSSPHTHFVFFPEDGNEMLQWIGYNIENKYDLKKSYLQILSNNFVKDEDYKQFNASEMKNFYVDSGFQIELPNDVNHHNKTKHQVVAPDCFKESLMLMKTDKAKEIRKYFIALEKVFKSYLTYCNLFNQHQHEETKAELQKSKQQFTEMMIKKNLLKLDQYIYVATNATYAKNNIFEIGMANTIEKCLAGYTTGRYLGDKFSYVYIMKCVDAKSLEQYIFSRLENFRYEEERVYKREFYQIHFSMLMNIMDEYELFKQQTTIKFNRALTEYYDRYTSLTPISYDELL